MRIHDKLYWYPYRGPQNNSNTCIFTGEMRVLVDPGCSFNFENLIHSIRKDGLNIEDIDLIIISHGHPDHYEVTSQLGTFTKAKVAIHKIEKEYIFKHYIFGEKPNFKVDFVLADELDLNGLKLQILHTPGHSPGSISLYWPDGKALYTGDVVFYQAMGRTDILGGDTKALKQSIDLLSKLEVEYLLPGHHYGFPPNHQGFIRGKENVQKNFEYIKSMFE